MKEQYLTLAQNTCAARIFLNTFGFTLENINNIDEFSKIKIFDNNQNTVGELHFYNGKVVINVRYNNNILKANYDISKIFSFIDKEYNYAIFGQWSSKIAFQVQNNDIVKLSGEFLISCSIDSEFGNNCLCQPLINCKIPEKGNVTLKILRNGLTFGLEISDENYYEEICIIPNNELTGFIRHDIKKGKYDMEKSSYPYRKYAGIFNGAEVGEEKNKLHIFLSEDEYQNNLSFYNEMVTKITNNNSSDALIQKGLLMKKLDPEMFKKINQLQQLLLIDDISLLDNLFSVCYDIYSDEELKALLGINRIKMTYQNGANSLIDSYFGIGKDNQFLSVIQQKRLLKK